MTRLTLALLFVPTIVAAQLPRAWVDASVGFSEADLSGYIGGTQIVGQVGVGAAVHEEYGIELGLWETPGLFGGYKTTDLCTLPLGSTKCFVQNPLTATAATFSAVRHWGGDLPIALSIGVGDYALAAPNNYSSSSRALGIEVAAAGEPGWSHGAVTPNCVPRGGSQHLVTRI